MFFFSCIYFPTNNIFLFLWSKATLLKYCLYLFLVSAVNSYTLEDLSCPKLVTITFRQSRNLMWPLMSSNWVWTGLCPYSRFYKEFFLRTNVFCLVIPCPSRVPSPCPLLLLLPTPPGRKGFLLWRICGITLGSPRYRSLLSTLRSIALAQPTESFYYVGYHHILRV